MSGTRRTFVQALAAMGLAAQGKPRWWISRERFPRIECAPGGGEPVRYAAAELDRYLRRILGAQGAGGPAAIALVTAGDRDLGEEGFEISCRGDRLTIRGSEAGVVYGAFEFLRRFGGCSFAGVGPDCENVPRRARIEVDVPSLRMKPGLWYRAYQFFYPEPLELSIQRLDWMVRNGLNYVTYTPRPDDIPDHFTANDPYTGASLSEEPLSFSESWFKTNLLPEIVKRGLKLDFNHHNLFYWMPPDRYFEKHPEWYALVNGKRVREGKQLAICTSNEEAVATLVANVKRFLRDNPRVRIVAVIPEDGLGMCQCDNCVRGDPNPRDAFRPYRGNKSPDAENKSKSLRYARLVNRVAREVRAEHPGVLVGSASYVDLQWPPDGVKYEPNVITWFAVYWRDGSQPLAADSPSPANRFFFDLLRKWRAAHPGHFTLYEYYMGMDSQRSLPYPMAEVICRDWPELKRIEVEGATIQSWSSNHNSYALNNLAFARSGWQARVDYDALLDEFLAGMFGSAAPEMKPVFQKLRKALDEAAANQPKSLFLSGYSATDAGRGSLLPDAYSIGYFLEQLGPDLDAAIARAKSKAADDRERRQVEYFAAVTVYWRKSAEALRLELLARKAGRDRAPELFKDTLVKEQEALDYARSLPARGWMSVTLPRVWRRSMSDVKRRLAAVQ